MAIKKFTGNEIYVQMKNVLYTRKPYIQCNNYTFDTIYADPIPFILIDMYALCELYHTVVDNYITSALHSTVVLMLFALHVVGLLYIYSNQPVLVIFLTNL